MDEVRIEFAVALPDRQQILAVTVPAGTRVRDVLSRSGLVDAFPDIDPGTCPVGVFGRLVADDYEPVDGDRIEVYRPLTLDPKQARRKRAKSAGRVRPSARD